MKILKKTVGVSCLIVLILMLSGCTTQQSPSGYPSRDNIKNIDIELRYDSPIFYFGDVVQDDGSVNQSKTVNWTLTIINNGTEEESVRFEIIHFPYEIVVGATIETTIPTDFDYDDMEFDRLRIYVASNTSMDFVFSITFNETVAWSYNPDTSYSGHFEIEKTTVDPKCENIVYEKSIVPFIVRT